MTKKHSTKRALIASILVLCLCLTSFIGTTFAWFTDSVTSANNIIKSGTLDVEMYYADGTLAVPAEESTSWEDASKGAIFSYDNWEPGYAVARHIKIANEGTLALKYSVRFLPNGEVSELANVIDVYYADPAVQVADRTALTDDMKLGTLADVLANMGATANGTLEAGKNDTITLVLKMQESAGNEYQDMSIGADFAIQLVATQTTAEFDSFDNQYDVNADFDYPFYAFGNADVKEGETSYNIPLTYVSDDNTSVAAGSATVPAAAIANDASTITATVKKVNTDSNFTIASGSDVTTLDIKVTGLKEGNTDKIEVAAKITAGLVNVVVYHYNDVMGAADYSYDPMTGIITIKSATFSPFNIVYDEKSVDEWDGEADTSWYNETDKVFTLTSAEQFAGFAKLVNNLTDEFEGKTVKLGTNIDLSGKNFTPIGGVDKDAAFQGTFDGNGYAIYGLTQNGWDLGYYYGQTAGMGLFGWIGNATIKNVVLDGAEISMEAVVMGGIAGYAGGDCTFSNIIVKNSQIANYNWDTGGIVGQVYASGSTFVFEDIRVEKSTTISGHWGTWDVSAGGVIGRTADGVKVKMTNVYVGCVLDVYNDACAAYQWFAYRYSGMIVGYTKTTTTENGRTTATAPHVTCENVTVEYGDWMNYTYCQPSNVSPQYVRVQGGYSTDPYYSGRHWTAGVDAEGNKMVDDNHVHTEGQAHNVVLAFDQLFGGGQGVYGTATHEGVKVIYPASYNPEN